MPTTPRRNGSAGSLSPSRGLYFIADREFAAIRRLIYQAAGVALSDTKRALVCSRLARRLQALGLRRYEEYLDFLARRDPDGEELQQMVNCLTTHKTDFFREAHHFEYLRRVVLPEIEHKATRGGPTRIRIWSAGCSTGNEAYSVAMTILEHFPSLAGWDVKIIASDIDTDVLRVAEDGVYSLSQAAAVPEGLKHRYFLRGTGRCEGRVQLKPEVRRLVSFQHLNLVADDWPQLPRFDAIFCRNTIIYFDERTQRKLLPRLAAQLSQDGRLMLGHSENLPWTSAWFVPLGNTTHQVRSGVTPVAPEAGAREEAAAGMPAPPVAAARPKETRPEESPLPRRTIIAGETLATRTPTQICTTLGSCVAACLFDPAAGIGGMNHFMLPCDDGAAKENARYGVHAMELLINEIMKLGGDRRRLQAKVFGGANLSSFEKPTFDVGQKNARFVRQFLDVEGIPITAEQLGGTLPLRVQFYSHTGQAFVASLGRPREVASHEARLIQVFRNQFLRDQRNSVTLF